MEDIKEAKIDTLTSDLNDTSIDTETEERTKIERNVLKYKNIANNSNLMDNKNKPSKHTLNSILSKKYDVKDEPWCKLNKTTKLVKIQQFVEIYKDKHEMNSDEENRLVIFLKDCLDKKKLQRIKDVNYDKFEGVIKDIPGLLYIKSKKHFTLKNNDKRVSTLKSLGPKKIQQHSSSDKSK